MNLIDTSFLKEVTVAGCTVCTRNGLDVTLVERSPFARIIGMTHQLDATEIDIEDIVGVHPNEIALERMTFYLEKNGIPVGTQTLKPGWLPKVWACYQRGDFWEKRTIHLLERWHSSPTPIYFTRLLSCYEEWPVLRKTKAIHIASGICSAWGPDTETCTYIGEP